MTQMVGIDGCDKSTSGTGVKDGSEWGGYNSWKRFCRNKCFRSVNGRNDCGPTSSGGGRGNPEALIGAAALHVVEGGSDLVPWCLVPAVSAAVGTSTMGPAVHARTWGGLSTTFTTTTTTVITTITTTITTTVDASWLVVGTRSRWSGGGGSGVGSHDGN